MADIGVAVLERARAPFDLGGKFLAHHQGADRLVAGAQALGERDHVRHHPVLLAGEEGAGPPHPGHHLVEDHERAMRVADAPDLLEVAGRRGRRAKRRADHRLGHEGDCPVRAEIGDLGFECARRAQPEGFGAFAVALIAVGVARHDVAHIRVEDRQVDLLAVRVSADRKRAQRIAVIGLFAGDEMVAGCLAALDLDLARELERGLVGLRSAGQEIDPPLAARRLVGQDLGQFFRRPVGKERRMGEGELVELVLDRLDDAPVGMPETGDRRAAGRVEIALALGIDQIGPVAACGLRE